MAFLRFFKRSAFKDESTAPDTTTTTFTDDVTLIHSISIPKYKISGDHVEYGITCVTTTSTWLTYKRYQQFKILDQQLRIECAKKGTSSNKTSFHCRSGVLPILCGSHWMEVTNQSPKLVEERRWYLEIYLQQLLVSSNLFYRRDSVLYNFLKDGAVVVPNKAFKALVALGMTKWFPAFGNDKRQKEDIVIKEGGWRLSETQHEEINLPRCSSGVAETSHLIEEEERDVFFLNCDDKNDGKRTQTPLSSSKRLLSNAEKEAISDIVMDSAHKKHNLRHGINGVHDKDDYATKTKELSFPHVLPSLSSPKPKHMSSEIPNNNNKISRDYHNPDNYHDKKNNSSTKNMNAPVTSATVKTSSSSSNIMSPFSSTSEVDDWQPYGVCDRCQREIDLKKISKRCHVSKALLCAACYNTLENEAKEQQWKEEVITVVMTAQGSVDVPSYSCVDLEGVLVNPRTESAMRREDGSSTGMGIMVEKVSTASATSTAPETGAATVEVVNLSHRDMVAEGISSFATLVAGEWRGGEGEMTITTTVGKSNDGKKEDNSERNNNNSHNKNEGTVVIAKGYEIKKEGRDGQLLCQFSDSFMKDKEGLSLQSLIKSLADFQLITVIGRGTFGKMYRSKFTKTGQEYALKVLNKNAIARRGMVPFIKEENDILMLVTDHPFICKCYASFQTDHNLFFAFEYLPGGDLYRLVTERHLTEPEVRFYLSEIVLALEYCHRLGVIHRDLKQENIVLDREGHCRLIDFGLGWINTIKNRGRSFVGSTEFISPEIIRGDFQTIAVDWWSLGVMTYEILFGISPFFAMKSDDVYEAILHQELKFPMERRVSVSDAALDFIAQLLQKDVSKRLTSITSIKKHPFFAGVDWREVVSKKTAPPFVPFLKYCDVRYFNEKCLCEWAVLKNDSGSLENDPMAAARLTKAFSKFMHVATSGSLEVDQDTQNNSKNKEENNKEISTALTTSITTGKKSRSGKDVGGGTASVENTKTDESFSHGNDNNNTNIPQAVLVKNVLRDHSKVIVTNETLQGFWWLVKLSMSTEDGMVCYPWGNVTGLLIYGKYGIFSFQAAPAKRPLFKSSCNDKITLNELSQAYQSYAACAGKFACGSAGPNSTLNKNSNYRNKNSANLNPQERKNENDNLRNSNDIIIHEIFLALSPNIVGNVNTLYCEELTSSTMRLCTSTLVVDDNVECRATTTWMRIEVEN